ncbi:hypothetical protein KRR23_14560 [Pseudomonas sp. CVAP|uniref:hypothetical protein n=1 Tax=Pseudomonas sp. CVAP\|nr:hypothetical protein [Pseudomonas sp. CVAP\
MLSAMGIFSKKMDRYLKSNLKAAAYAAKGRFCYPQRAVVHQRQQDSPQEKGQKQKHRKSKNQHRFPCRIGGRRSAEIAAFLLLSNNKDPSLKKIFKGPSEKIFLLTPPNKNSRRSHTRFV